MSIQQIAEGAWPRVSSVIGFCSISTCTVDVFLGLPTAPSTGVLQTSYICGIPSPHLTLQTCAIHVMIKQTIVILKFCVCASGVF